MRWGAEFFCPHWRRGRVRPAWIGPTVILLVLLTAGWWWATLPPPGVTREVAGLVGDLQRRPAVYQRLATACATRLHSGARRFLPGFLNADSVDLKRLEACHRLVALGSVTRPAVPLMVRAFSDRDSTVAFYSFLALVHSTAPAPEVVVLARSAWSSGTGPAYFYAGLLATEDERVRDFAWQCLEAAGDDARVVGDQLRSLANEGGLELRNRATALLQRLEVRSNPPPASNGSP